MCINAMLTNLLIYHAPLALMLLFFLFCVLHLTSVLLVDENVSVPGLSSLHADNSLVDVVEAVLGGPSLDLVLGGEFEDFSDILW